jgi:UDP-2,4-diacetamido-2,4,6-trideoxy-beta-L-altropyranose hydrolase
MTGTSAAPERLPVRFRVAIRADASNRIGAGHVMRCVALAQALLASGHDVVFVIREADGDLRDTVAERHGFDVFTLSADTTSETHMNDELADARQTLAALDTLPVDWVVVDHYGLGARWEAHIAATGPRILAIDDYATRDHACDLLLDHNIVKADAYAAHVQPDTGLLLGPRYALLRPEFTRVSSEYDVPEAPRTIVVSFGGSDPTGQTTKTLDAIRLATCTPERVIAVTGRDHPDLDLLRTIAKEWPPLELHTFVDDPAALLMNADLGIGAGGVSALERLAMGIPSIVLATADNQRRPAEALANEGAFLYLGPASTSDADALAAGIDTMSNQHLRLAMRRRGTAMLDGRGPERIVRAMVQRVPITMRAATEEDRERVFLWRNDPAIRVTAFDPSEISSSAHARWFERVLSDPDRHLLVAEHREAPVGVIRYDLDRANATAEVSIFLAPAVLGIGLGQPALIAANNWLTSNEPDILRIRAHVRGSNPRSHQLFESVGFHKQRTTFELEQATSQSAIHGNANRGGV